MAFTVAIDGPAASGKGTVARTLATRFGFAYLDTGLLYRATARKALDGYDPVVAAKALKLEDLDRDDLRLPDVAQAASRVAANKDVRAALLEFQRNFAEQPCGAVLDGRDIGSVICPSADVKLFITASEVVRANRRLEELLGKGIATDYETVLEDLRQRDSRDTQRASAPLKPADDAIEIDTTHLTVAEVVETAADIIEARR